MILNLFRKKKEGKIFKKKHEFYKNKFLISNKNELQ